MQHRLEKTLNKIRAYQLNNQIIPQSLIKDTLHNISELLNANKILISDLLIQQDQEGEEMVINHDQLIIIKGLQSSLKELEHE